MLTKKKRVRILAIRTVRIRRKGRLYAIKPSEMERILLEDGWKLYAQKGSHRQYKHPDKPGKVTIPFHKGKEINPITEQSIRKQAGLV